MPTYVPTNHPELSAAAAALTAEQLAFKATRAEALLGIAGSSYTGTSAISLTLAVALQINRTLRLEARAEGEGGDVVREQKGDQLLEYSKTKDGLIDPVDPEAGRIVAGVLASETAPPELAMPVSRTTPNVFAW